MLAQKVAVNGVGLRVVEPLLGRELYRDTHQLVGGQVGPGQVVWGALVDDGTCELGQSLVPAVGTFGRGGEAEGVRREEHLGDEGVLGGGEVVDLVVDDEGEPVPVALGVDVGRVVGCNGERRHLVVAATEQADRHRGAECVREDRVPLLEQGEGGHDYQRAAPDAFDGADRDRRLPRPRRQNDHPPQARGARPPGIEGLSLVGPGLERHPGLQGDFLEGRRTVDVRRLVVAEAQDGLPIRAGRGAPLAGTPVPYERLRQARRRGAGRD